MKVVESPHADSRYARVALCLVSAIIYATRTMLPPTATMMSTELGWNTTQLTTVMGSFQFGYIWLQVAAGFLISFLRNGSFLPMTCMMFGSGIALLLCSVAKSTNALGSALIMLGFCHAPTVPGIVSVIATQVPKKDQPAIMVTNGVFTSMANVAASYGGPHLVLWLGWRRTFRFFAALSCVGGFAWVVLMRRYNKPEEADHKSLDKKRRRRFFSIKFPLRWCRPGMMPEWVSLFGHPSVWAIVVAHSAGNYSNAMMDSWAPKFYQEELSLPPVAAASYQMTARVFELVGGLLMGKLIVPRLLAKYSTSTVCTRRSTTGTAFMGAAACYYVFSRADVWSRLMSPLRPEIVATVAVCTRALLFTPLHSFGYSASYLDLGGKHVAVLSATSNTIANIFSYVATATGGYILQHSHNWNFVFDSAVAVYVFAAVVYSGLIVSSLRGAQVQPVSKAFDV